MEPPSGEEAAASGQQDEFEEAVDNSEFAQEQAAQDRLDIIYSTEDIKWGNSIRKTTSNTILGVSTQMNAQRLLELQEAAVKNKGLLIKDGVMVIPVFLEDGTPAACISHLITNVACQHLLGGLRAPSEYHMPKNIECMRLMADALSVSLLRVQKMSIDAAIEEVDPEEAHREVLMRHLTALNKDKNGIFKMINKNRKGFLKSMHEIKNYASPPEVLVKVMVALFVLLDTPGFEEYLGEDYDKYPNPSTKVWTFTRGHIIVQSRHPNSILRLLGKGCKGKSMSNGGDAEKEKVMKGVESWISDVEMSAVERASQVGTVMLKWVKLTLHQAKLESELGTIENTYIVEKRRKKAKDDWKALGVHLMGLGAMGKDSAAPKWRGKASKSGSDT